MKKRILAFTITLALVASMLAGCGVVKVIKIGEEGKYTGDVEFDADAQVKKFWNKKAIPELNKKAVDINELLTEANGDLKSVADKYGKYSMGDSGELTYVVKGTGTVEDVDTKSRAGYLVVKPEGYSGNEEIKIQIGPVYKASAVRDALSFLKYGDYKNQEEWAKVSQSINKKLDKEVVKPADPENMKGKTIEFEGAFTISSVNSDILIMPIELKAK